MRKLVGASRVGAVRVIAPIRLNPSDIGLRIIAGIAMDTLVKVFEHPPLGQIDILVTDGSPEKGSYSLRVRDVNRVSLRFYEGREGICLGTFPPAKLIQVAAIGAALAEFNIQNGSVTQADRFIITRRAEEASGQIISEIAAKNGIRTRIEPLESTVVMIDGRHVS